MVQHQVLHPETVRRSRRPDGRDGRREMLRFATVEEGVLRHPASGPGTHGPELDGVGLGSVRESTGLGRTKVRITTDDAADSRCFIS